MIVGKVARIVAAVSLILCVLSTGAMAVDSIKIAQVVGVTGALEVYAKQSITGFEMGLEYATKGAMKLLDRPIQIITKDTQGKPDVGKQMLTEAFKDDKADLAVGGVSSAVAKAMLPVLRNSRRC